MILNCHNPALCDAEPFCGEDIDFWIGFIAGQCCCCIHMLAEMMLKPSKDIAYRDGRTKATTNVGTEVALSPIYLLLDAMPYLGYATTQRMLQTLRGEVIPFPGNEEDEA